KSWNISCRAVYETRTYGSMGGARFYSPSTLLFFPVMIYVLNVIVILEQIQCLLQVLDRVVVCQGYIRLRNHGNIRFRHGDSLFFQCLADSGEIIRIRENLVAVFLLTEILGSRVKSDHHQIVGIHLALLFVDNNLSLLVKHKGDAALSSDAAVSLGERASDISCSTVL